MEAGWHVEGRPACRMVPARAAQVKRTHGDATMMWVPRRAAALPWRWTMIPLKHRRLSLVPLASAAILACGGDTIIQQVSGPSGAPSGSIVAVTPLNHLFFVSPSSPGVLLGVVEIIGLQPAETLNGIDFRPQTGDLYGYGSTGRLYRISTQTGFAAQVGTVAVLVVGATQFGMDFNPVADRIRIVTDNEFNARLDPTNNNLINDTSLAPAGNVVAVAYTNNFAGATTTTLFGIDTASDSLVRIGGVDGIPSPNGGAVTAIGPLGVDATTASFDISPSGTAYAALEENSITNLYTIDLATGAATLVGTLAAGGAVRGIAVAP